MWRVLRGDGGARAELPHGMKDTGRPKVVCVEGVL